jgi:cytoskeletal protein RodZ
MAEIRETHVKRDEHGRVTDTKVIIEHPKKKGGFGLGLLLGVILIAGALLAFVYSQGSFQEAAREADQVTAQVEQQTAEITDSTANTLSGVADTTADAASETSETVTN